MTENWTAERLLFGDELEHLFIARLRHGDGVREQRLALLAALVPECLVL